MIAVFYIGGKVVPIKFKYQDKSIKVERILKQYKEKLAGNERIVFVCMHNERDPYELKYEVDSQKWFLYKK